MPDPAHAKRSEKGQSLVELAVGMIVLLILLAGIIDLGRLLFFYISLRDAAQEGAVYGQIHNETSQTQYCAAINSRIASYLNNPSGLVTTITMDNQPCASASNTNTCSGKEIKVNVKSPFTFVMPLIGGQTITLMAEITGTILRPPC
jgi:Flp pilus assembly protein TadG